MTAYRHFAGSKPEVWTRANLNFRLHRFYSILNGQLKTLRDIQSILVTINTHGYDVLIQIHHRPKAHKTEEDPQEQLQLKVPSGQSPNQMS